MHRRPREQRQWASSQGAGSAMRITAFGSGERERGEMPSEPFTVILVRRRVPQQVAPGQSTHRAQPHRNRGGAPATD